MVVVDRYSGWPIVQQSRDGSSGLIKRLREIFVIYGIADELWASDGGPEFTAEETQQLLSNWGVHHRLSSVALAHSNGRAELGVKTCKRMLMDNTGPNGEINLDKFQRGMLQYRNTPDRDPGLSPPAQMIFERPIKDFIPILPGSYRPHNTWIETSRAREEAMRARNVRNAERPTEHTVRLQPLKVGDRVFIQNQTGNLPLRWDRTGLVIEVKQFDQYAVKVDGSGRVTLRNRKFLRKFDMIVVHHIPGTTRTIQPLKTLNNTENLSPVNQRVNPEQAQDPPKAKPQTPHSETSVKFWPVHSSHNTPRDKLSHIPPRDTGSYNQSPAQVQLSTKWVPRRWEQAFAGQDIIPHILSAGSPDKESRCCDKLNKTGSPNESPLAKNPRITHGLHPDGPREKNDPLWDLGTTFDCDSPPRPTTTSSHWRGREMYNVANSIITDRKMYRCIFEVSFYFRGSLYEINVLLTLFLQIEVSILPPLDNDIKCALQSEYLPYIGIGAILPDFVAIEKSTSFCSMNKTHIQHFI